MVAAQLLSLYSTTQASSIKRLAALNLPFSIRSYKQGKKESSSGHGVEERAPSTAEEFERVAEEKSRHGASAATQTAEKAQDAAAEAATAGESTFESVKEAYKEPPGKGNFDKTDDQP